MKNPIKLSAKLGLMSLVLLMLLFTSCGNSSNSKSASQILYTSGGRTSEVLVVISDNLWNSPLGDSIKAYLQSTPAWLSREEPEYDISQIPYATFGNVYQKQRNILFIKRTELAQPKIELSNDLYASPQSLISIKASTDAELMATFMKFKTRIKDTFHKNELKRIKSSYKGLEIISLTKQVEKKFGFSMVFPKGFYVAADQADFMWLRRPTREVEEGILIYTSPYSDTLDFSAQSIRALRNKMSMQFIPGPVEGSFMKVSDIFPEVATHVSFKGHYATEYRSFWDVNSYPMGGPFISYTFVDSVASRLITIDGYIKAPKKEKRDLILHLEAIMDSFKYEAIEVKD